MSLLRFAVVKQDAESGDVEAQFNLGAMYYHGRGVQQDFAEAVKWYRLAADQGLADAQHNLGERYRYGNGVPQDDAEAMKLFFLAADQGNAKAQFNLGAMYATGQGVPQDEVEAYAWHYVAATRYAMAKFTRDIAAGKLTPEQLSQGQKRAAELLENISSGK